MHIAIISMLVCVGLILSLRRIAHRLGAVDHPGGLKQHEHPTPTVGGLAMFIAVLATLIFIDGLDGKVEIVVDCAAALLILGVWDDRRNLSVSLRIMMQVFLVLVVIVGAKGAVKHLGGVFDIDIPLGMFAIPFSAIAFVGGINAINMIDGADGMAGSMALITALGAAAIFYLAGDTQVLSLAMAVIGALAGFLLFNSRLFVKRAWIFMGNGGSLWLGLVLGWFMAQLTRGSVSAEPALVLWLFGIPLMDTLRVMVRRLKSKRSPFAGDRTHIHHVLEYSRLSVRQTVLVLSLAQLALNGIGVYFYVSHTPGLVVFWSFALLMAAYFYRLRHFSQARLASSIVNIKS